MASPRATGRVSYDNTGRVVLVSGGAAGIGRAICEAFAASGAFVICFDIADDQLPDPDPLGVEFVRGDVSVADDCRNAVRFAVETHGGIDVLVNNAAIQPLPSYCPVDELPQELWQRMVDVNLSGYTNLAGAALVEMKRQRSGVVVNLASGQGHRTARHVPAYGPLKAANIMQARQWGIEYARWGVRVVSVSPGAVNTAMVQATLAQQGGAAALANRHPLGRIAEPHEIAAAVLWLCSPGASFVTATDLEVDGGLGAFGAFADPYLPT